jgi:protein SCO1/2
MEAGVQHSRISPQILLVSLLLLSGCKSSDRHYVLTGRVVSKVPATHTVVVDHDDIPGFMSAMTMPYPVEERFDVSKIAPGDRIRARVIVKADQRYWLDDIVVTDSSHREQIATEGRQLSPGESVPDVELLNQDGKPIHLSNFRGKALLLTFIYTRCPMPTFCPRISSLFASVNRELAKSPKEYERTRLLSISIDPKYDNPSVLHKYGLAYLRNDPAGFSHWQFATPSPVNLKKLADAFSLLYEEEDNQISHTMSTVLVGPDGRVAKEWIMSDWTTDEALSAIRQVENAAQ